ncbi:MAG: PH domain-containing protein [Propionicimonas sp.]
MSSEPLALSDPTAHGGGTLVERPHWLTPLIRGWVVLLAIGIAFGRELLPDGREPGRLPPLEWLVPAVAAACLVAAATGFATWRFTRFVINQTEVRIDTGAVFRTSKRLAFERIQSIDVVQPFAARIFGLAEVQIDVGGESTRLRYLSLRRAYGMRDYLLARAHGYQVTPEQTAQEHSPIGILADLHASDEVLVRVATSTLLVAAVTSHEFFGILATGLAAVAFTWWFQQPWLALGFGIPMISTLLGFIGRRVTGQFNYTLTRRPTGLRISRGLTSLTSQSLPARRVQAVQISQSLAWRALGFYRIDLEVIGWGEQTDEEGKAGISTIMLPAGTADQVRVALAALWPSADYTGVELTSAPKRARWLHPFSAPFLGWGFDDRIIVTRHGWLVRRWQVVPLARTQSLRLGQGLVARALGLADLAVHTAGRGLAVHAAGIDAAQLGAAREALIDLVGEPRGQDVAGPEARRADQAEATISSTE